jgi:hypothetical protein
LDRVIDYRVLGPLRDLSGFDPAILDVGERPDEVCWPVHGLIVPPSDVATLGLASERFGENRLRPAAKLIERLLAMDPAPLNVRQTPEQRVIGTWRHFALLACALLRHRGIPTWVRCGFATYFQPGQSLDHWITEFHGDSGRWVRVDPEVVAQSKVGPPEDLRPDEFPTAAEAWIAFRRRAVDADTFGVFGTGNWGPGETRGNLVKDLAALNKVEMLPWDVWGRMEDAYQGRVGDADDDLLDVIAAACAADDLEAILALYSRRVLRVPEELIC